MSIPTLYGIGVGPGDPDLLTVKAVKTLAEVDVIFAAGNERNVSSLALEIAGPHLPDAAKTVALHFPHTFDSVDGRSPHREAAQTILTVLKEGKSAAFLTLGDPMTFSTFTYVLEAVRELEPTVAVKVVPGITSFAAAAAATVTPLTEGEETLTVIGAARGGVGAIEEALERSDSVVIMKPFRQTAEVCDLLEAKGLSESTWYCTECSRPTEKLSRGTEVARTGEGRYMSLFLVRSNRLKDGCVDDDSKGNAK